MPRKKTQKALTLKAMLTIAPELDQVSRELASLAVAQLAQEGHLGVRQGEQLRRVRAHLLRLQQRAAQSSTASNRSPTRTASQN